MAFSTEIRRLLNRLLNPLNIQIGTLTARKQEIARLDSLLAAKLFDKPIYTLLPGMAEFDPGPLSRAYASFREQISKLEVPEAKDVGYVHKNDYFTSPDMEVLYLLVRTLKPNRIVEIGCGNSTRISRQAIMDGGLATELIGIDPSPRIDVAPFVDRIEQSRVEDLNNHSIFESLEKGDFLFIDSSHEVRVGNDVARLFCDIIPELSPGIVVHVHDVFLPLEYPPSFAYDYTHWGEQYMLHALLQGRPCDVIWPGYYIQECRPDIAPRLPFLSKGRAQSFWVVLN